MQRCSFLSTAGNDSCFLTDISKIVALFQTRVKPSFNQKVLYQQIIFPRNHQESLKVDQNMVSKVLLERFNLYL